MQRIKSFVLGMLVLFALWVAIAGTDRDELAAGFLIALLVSWFFRRNFELLGELRLNPQALLRIPVYLAVFLRELVKSTLDVARRVLNPSLPINPGIVKVRTKLRSKLGRIILANSITLTPGTMTVETRGEYFYIHWIDTQCEDVEAATRSIVHCFEQHLEVIFG